ncbi:MAG: M1 family peptidase, partial [Gelidibacter sp.]
SKTSGLDLKAFFNQYLRYSNIPTLEYSIKDKQLKYRWVDTVPDFEMPIQVYFDGKEQWLHPKSGWSTTKIKDDDIQVDDDFYVRAKKL